jgi:hypothetical protein
VIASVTGVMAFIEVEDKTTLGLFVFCAILGMICKVLSMYVIPETLRDYGVSAIPAALGSTQQ